MDQEHDARQDEEDAPGVCASIDRGTAGASAAREHDRRRRNREQATRDAHPRIGGVLNALRSTHQHEAAFEQGASGEEKVAVALERRTADGPTVLLHDRRMPRGHGNIDHLAVSPGGVFVIDAKALHGQVRVARPLFGKEKLTVAGRDRTKLIDGLERQIGAVGAILEPAWNHVPVHGVLCFTAADLPLVRTLRIRGHELLYPRALSKRLNSDGPLDAVAIDETARALAAALPPA